MTRTKLQKDTKRGYNKRIMQCEMHEYWHLKPYHSDKHKYTTYSLKNMKFWIQKKKGSSKNQFFSTETKTSTERK